MRMSDCYIRERKKMTDGYGNDYCSSQNDTRQFSPCTNLFEAFSCTCLHPDPKSWCLDRLEEVPSFLGGIRSASNSIENCPHRREGVSEHVSLGKPVLFLNLRDAMAAKKQSQSM